MLKKLFSSLSLMLTLAVFTLILIMGGEKKASPASSDQEQLTSVGLYSSAELTALTRHFGAPIPYLNLSVCRRLCPQVYLPRCRRPDRYRGAPCCRSAAAQSRRTGF